MISKLQPAIWSCGTGQRIPCFDSCHLTVRWMCNIKAGVWSPCCASSSSLCVRAREQYCWPFLPCEKRFKVFFSMGHRLPALQAPGAPLLAAHLFRHKVRVNIYTVYFNSSEVYKWSSGNRPFAGSSHMARNKLHWDANDAVGLSKQRKVTLDW